MGCSSKTVVELNCTLFEKSKNKRKEGKCYQRPLKQCNYCVEIFELLKLPTFIGHIVNLRG